MWIFYQWGIICICSSAFLGGAEKFFGHGNKKQKFFHQESGLCENFEVTRFSCRLENCVFKFFRWLPLTDITLSSSLTKLIAGVRLEKLSSMHVYYKWNASHSSLQRRRRNWYYFQEEHIDMSSRGSYQARTLTLWSGSSATESWFITTHKPFQHLINRSILFNVENNVHNMFLHRYRL